MKMSTTLTLFALFLLSAFTSRLPSATAQVSDIHGRPVRNPGVYYILPAIMGISGGIQPAATGNETCPLTVVVSNSVDDLGRLVRMSSPLRIPFIPIDSDLHYEFVTPDSCAPDGTWTLVDGLHESEGVQSVKLSGYKNSVSGSFRIRALGFRTYKLVFCERSSDRCVDIGVSVDKDGNQRLVATENNPLAVVFLQPFFLSTAAAAA